LERLIIEKFEQIKNIVPLEPKTYVMDFAVDITNNRVYVIELNPFGEYEGMGTSTSMFDKIKDHEVLFGNGPWEFRIETKPIESMWPVLGGQWHDFFKSEYPNDQ